MAPESSLDNPRSATYVGILVVEAVVIALLFALSRIFS
jgi:hypothetical protein